MHSLYRPFPIGGKLINLYKEPETPASKDSEHNVHHSGGECERMMSAEKVWTKSKEALHGKLS